MKRKGSLINQLNKYGPNIDLCNASLAISCQSLYGEFILFAFDGLISNCVLNLNHSYQCHKLQVLQQEGHVTNNHKV